jgi:hypothetical protein
MTLAREETYAGRWSMDQYLKTVCKSAAKARLLKTQMIFMSFHLIRGKANRFGESACHFLPIHSSFTQTILSSMLH